VSSAHASKSPSKAAMWMNCAKALSANRGQTDLGDPSARNQGSALHTFRERALTGNLDPLELVGTITTIEGDEYELTEDQALSMTPGIEAIRAFGGELHVELRVSLEPWLGEDQFGTLDTGVITDELICIQDYKSGFDPVSPVDNEQLQLYALGFWHGIARHRTKATEFLLMIDQPNNYKGGPSEWSVSLEELLAFGERARVAAGVAEDPDAVGTPGVKTCRWCLAKAKCGELATFALDMIGISKTAMDDAMNDLIGNNCTPNLSIVEDLTPEQRVFIVDNAGLVRNWLDAVAAQTLADAIHGNPTPGKKAVLGKAGNRKWSDTQTVTEYLSDRYAKEDVFNIKLKGPAQIEKVLGKKNWPALMPFIVRSDPKAILVDENDPRDGLAPVADKFDDLETDDGAASPSATAIFVEDDLL